MRNSTYLERPANTTAVLRTGIRAFDGARRWDRRSRPEPWALLESMHAVNDIATRFCSALIVGARRHCTRSPENGLAFAQGKYKRPWAGEGEVLTF